MADTAETKLTRIVIIERPGRAIQILRRPDGYYLINTGTVDAAGQPQSMITLWSRGEIKQLRNALSRELADG